MPFATQVIVTSEIHAEQRSWLKCLTNHATAADLEAIVLNTPELDNRNKRYADNVMDVFTSANAELIKERI